MPKNNILKKIADFVAYAECHLYLKQEDGLFAFNRLLTLLHIKDASLVEIPPASAFQKARPDEVLAHLSVYAVEANLIPESERDYFECELMAAVLPMPSFFSEVFDSIASEEGVRPACDFFYNFCIKSNFIKSKDIFDNINWYAPASKGNLRISINAARPECGSKYESQYPLCPLCRENIGYGGNKMNPRQTLRFISIYLRGEEWLLQYSPFNYYNEHCTVICAQHTPMQIDKACFERLLEFVETFPHYFLGANSNLPLVGASNPSHNHYQGGLAELPIFGAKSRIRLSHPSYPKVSVNYLDWYSSAIKLTSRDTKCLSNLASEILDEWLKFEDAKCKIVSSSDEIHNSVTSIAQCDADGEYSLYLILRNNRTDEDHPLGIFAASPEVACIKSSPLGLMEVAGFFVLPARIGTDGEKIREILTGNTKLDFKSISEPGHGLHEYLPMIAQLAVDAGLECNEETAAKAIEDFINKACEKMLISSAVFPDSTDGKRAFTRFAKKVGLEVSEALITE